jgi:cytidine deaminase
MSGHTGQKCQQSGIYQATCFDRTQIALSKGDTFPPCGQCRQAVTWHLIRATVN